MSEKKLHGKAEHLRAHCGIDLEQYTDIYGAYKLKHGYIEESRITLG